MVKQIYFVPNSITAFGLLCGLFVVFKVHVLEPDVGVYEILYSSAFAILLAALADLFDGAIARIIRAESAFGSIFDSLADAISFGVAPSVLFLKSLCLGRASGLTFFAIVGAMLYTVCGVLRLVRFNVKAEEAKRGEVEPISGRKHFTGLPIPAAAAGAISVNLLLHSPFIGNWVSLSRNQEAIGLTFVMIGIGYFMISKWKFPGIEILRIRVASFSLLFFTVIFVIVVLYGISHYFPLLLFVVSFGYIATGCLLTAIRLIAGKKSRTLIDFEPEGDEEEF